MRIILSCCLLFLPIIGLQAQDKYIFYDQSRKETSDKKKASFISVIKKTDSGWLQHDFYTSTRQFQMTGLYADDSLKVKNGCFRWYYADGKLNEAGCFMNNKRHRLRLSSHPNGSLEDSMVYNNGVLQNYGLSWHSNGIIYDSLVAINDSSVMQYRWFDNGYPDRTGILTNDKESGNWKYFHNNGQLAAEIDYRNGETQKARYFKVDGSPAAAKCHYRI